MPGMFVQTMAFGIGETLAAVQADDGEGVTDRFRSMPMAPSAVVVGRCVAAMVYSVVSLGIMVVCGFAVGWRWHGTIAEALAAFGLLLLLRLAFLWIGIFLGLKAKVGRDGQLDLRAALPGHHAVERLRRDRADADLARRHRRVEPAVGHGTATRVLFGNPTGDPTGWVGEHAMLLAVFWPLLITVATLPLAVRAYRKLSR